jgi:hypothetical protein
MSLRPSPRADNGGRPSVDRVADGWHVVADHPGQVVRLLMETGADDAARLWAKRAAARPTPTGTAMG